MNNKYSLLLTPIIMIALSNLSISKAQTPALIAAGETSKATTSSGTEPITLETPTGNLYGTLERPVSGTRVPIVLIIAGSGPTDRDGNSIALKGPNNSVKLLAEALATHGIASVRYDKRGIGETGRAMMAAAEKAKIVLREEDLSFEAYIDDAVGWGRKLGADPRFSSLTILGHSEGSLIGMVAAERLGTRAFVSIAGAGRSLAEVILDQLKSQPPELIKTSEQILAQLAKGIKVESVPSELNILFRPSVQPLLISWLRYDPTKEIAKLRNRILILQGTTDIQVHVADAQGLAGANPRAKFVLIDGMNHVLKTVPAELNKQVASYSDPTLPLAPALITTLAQFVRHE